METQKEQENLEKVIEGLNFVLYSEEMVNSESERALNDAISLLKEQQRRNTATPPIKDETPRYGMGYEYYDWLCPNCKAFLALEPAIAKIPKRCRYCGQLLKKPN